MGLMQIRGRGMAVAEWLHRVGGAGGLEAQVTIEDQKK